MAKGNEIIVSANPRGCFYEGPITGTPKPGTIMQPDISEGLNDCGELTWEVYTEGTDGYRPIGPLGILLPDSLQGILATTAYATGQHGFIYIPIAGEQFNCLVKNESGTADDHVFGVRLIPDSGTGLLIDTTGTVEIEPFILLEAITDPTADTLAHVMYTNY